MALIDLITKEVVKIPLQAATKEGVFRELVQLLADAGKVSDTEVAYDALITREHLMTTALEDGICIPHAKTAAVSSIAIALGIAPPGMDCQSLDGKPSHIFFVILAPQEQSSQHIEALSEIAAATRSSAFRRLLLTAQSPEEVVELFFD